MRRLILSDIHANIDALEAVLAHAQSRYDEIYCLGDVVGYGACPHEVVDWSRRFVKKILRGNHDRAVAGIENLDWFNPVARAAVLWTREQLSKDELRWLAALPEGPLLLDDCELVHGSPLDEDEYLVCSSDVAGLDYALRRPMCFFGHTHLQGGWEWRRRQPVPLSMAGLPYSETVVDLAPGSLYLINPGSVGQPRDRDPRAAYCIWDTEQRTLAFHRVEYPLERAQLRIRNAGLDSWLADRLVLGR